MALVFFVENVRTSVLFIMSQILLIGNFDNNSMRTGTFSCDRKHIEHASTKRYFNVMFFITVYISELKIKFVEAYALFSRPESLNHDKEFGQILQIALCLAYLRCTY